MKQIKYKLYERAIKKFGIQSQLIMVMEECAELQKAVSKFIRGKDYSKKIIREIADVEIMLEQLKIILAMENSKFIEEIELDISSWKNIQLTNLDKLIRD